MAATAPGRNGRFKVIIAGLAGMYMGKRYETWHQWISRIRLEREEKRRQERDAYLANWSSMTEQEREGECFKAFKRAYHGYLNIKADRSSYGEVRGISDATAERARRLAVMEIYEAPHANYFYSRCSLVKQDPRVQQYQERTEKQPLEYQRHSFCWAALEQGPKGRDQDPRLQQYQERTQEENLEQQKYWMIEDFEPKPEGTEEQKPSQRAIFVATERLKAIREKRHSMSTDLAIKQAAARIQEPSVEDHGLCSMTGQKSVEQKPVMNSSNVLPEAPLEHKRTADDTQGNIRHRRLKSYRDKANRTTLEALPEQEQRCRCWAEFMASVRDIRKECGIYLHIENLPQDQFEGSLSRRREQLYGSKGICEKFSSDPRVVRLREAPEEERARATKRDWMLG